MSYAEKLAEKNKFKYMKVSRIYLGESNVYLEENGKDGWQIVSPSGTMKLDKLGFHLSGDVEMDSNLVVKKNIEGKSKIIAKEIEDKSKGKE